MTNSDKMKEQKNADVIQNNGVIMSKSNPSHAVGIGLENV